VLEKLTLKNFQKHKLLEIEFDPLVTCVVGSTNSGKSCFLRGLKWVAANRPAGDGLVRRGAKAARGTLVADGRTVVRRRGKGLNEYRLDGQRYAAFGAGVPDAVADLLRVGPETWAGQHSPPFLFSLSPGQAAQALNEVIDLGLIDRTLAALAAGLRKAKAEQEVAAERLKAARAARDRLAWVPMAVAMLTKAVNLQNNADALAASVAQGVELLTARRVGALRRDRGVRASLALARAVAAAERAVALRDRADRAADLLARRAAVAVEVEQARADAAAVQRVLDNVLRGRCPACGRGGVK